MNGTSSAPSPLTAARPYIGGQALLEGVMMRSPRSFAIACRRRTGALVMRERPIVDERVGWRARPLLRGVATLVESLRLGFEALQFSAQVFESDLDSGDRRGAGGAGLSVWSLLQAQASRVLAAVSLPVVALVTRADSDEPGGASGGEGMPGGAVLWGTVIVFALGVFVVAPQAAAALINKLLGLGLDLRSPAFQLLTGTMKLLIVMGYMSLLRRNPQTRRTFQYHGAEHKTISTYEAGEGLSVGNARRKTTLHPRCGTTFLVMVAMVSVVVFSFVSPLLPRLGVPGGVAENALLLAMKLPFLPVIAAITFELQRLFARHCTTGPLQVLLWPGFLVQKITTIEPDDDQLEVALSSLRATLWREEAPHAAPATATELTFASYGDVAAHPGYRQRV